MQQYGGLYIHIPFCQAKCEYCDFYSITQLDQIDAFVNALLTEIKLQAPAYQGTTFQTVFFGGGTPSLLNQTQLSSIWDSLHHNFNIHAIGEFSIESNPGTLSEDKLCLFRKLGFNRLSIGVQSFNQRELTMLGRIHSVEEVFDNFKLARKAGFSNINLDLMTAFPGITETSFLYSLNQALSLKAEHLSCYTLIFEPGTALYKRMLKGEAQPLSDDEQAVYYQIAAKFLMQRGYHQYEISNFCYGDQNVCRHNLIYWKYQPYLGLGPSAHSFINGQRSGNKRSLSAYIKLLKSSKLPVDFCEKLSVEKQLFEYIFLSLRLKEGLNVQDFQQRFGHDFQEKYEPVVNRLNNDGLIELDDRQVRLSEKGWLLADSVAANF